MCKAVQWFRRKDKQVRSMHRHICRSTVLIVFRSEGSGAKQCSGFGEKISKAELCTGTAEEVLYLLCFRSEGSGANQCSGFEGKISKSELCIGTAEEVLYFCCVLEVRAQVQSSAVVSQER